MSNKEVRHHPHPRRAARTLLSRAILLGQGACFVVLGFLLANCRGDKSFVLALFPPRTAPATATAIAPATTTAATKVLTTREVAIERLVKIAQATTASRAAPTPDSAPATASAASPATTSTAATATAPASEGAPGSVAASTPAVAPTTETAAPAAARRVYLSDEELERIWNDPTFQKQFIGSYGINAAIEPRANAEDGTVIEAIRVLLAADRDLAAAELEKIIAVDPDCSAILDFNLGNIRLQQDDMNAALANYRRSVVKFPSFLRAWKNMGMIYARNGQFDEAITAFTKMIVLGGGDAYSYGLLGYAYASKKDYQAAEMAYRNALLLQPENTEWRLGLTRCVYQEQKYEDARTLLEGLIIQYPDKVDFWMLQANTFLNMKQPLKAAENLEAVDRMGKSTPESLYSLGEIYVGEELPDLAANAYCRAIVRDGTRLADGASAAQPATGPASQPAAGSDSRWTQVWARAKRAAELLASRGATDQAMRVAEQIHKSFDPIMPAGDQRSLLKLEARLTMAGGKSSPETAKVLEEIITLDPLDGEALMLLGQHYSRQNEPEKAMIYYERASSIEAYEANAKLRLAQLLVGLRRYADAVPLLRDVQKIKPRDDIARYLADVERMARQDALSHTPKPKGP